jgi:K+-transporting ATPase ATPase C chain
MVIVLTGLTGVAYPLLVTGIGKALFRGRAEGSLIERDGVPVGSELIAQPFTSPDYFWPRPSAASYNGGASAGANQGPLNPALHERVQGAVASLRAAHDDDGPVPVDLATASSSGLDPHLTPAAARYQVARVAAARSLSEEQVKRLVDDHTEGRQLGFLGEPRVNVLLLNLALDEVAPRRGSGAAPTSASASDVVGAF